MGIRYICDVCGKEYDIKGGMGPTGYQMLPSEPVPHDWAVITLMLPRCEHQMVSPIASTAYERMKGFSVCSLACAEKALGEVRDLLRQAFREL